MHERRGGGLGCRRVDVREEVGLMGWDRSIARQLVSP